MQGPCLYPFSLEKQTALRMVLEDLVINAGFARRLRIQQVRDLSLELILSTAPIGMRLRPVQLAASWSS